MVYFDEVLAKKYGMVEAILIQHIGYWVKYNAEEGENFRDGRTWTYMRLEDIAKRFVFLSESQIWRALDKLVKLGVILKGNFNKSKTTRTVWYTTNTEELPDISPAKSRDLKSPDFTDENSEFALVKTPNKELEDEKENEKEDNTLLSELRSDVVPELPKLLEHPLEQPPPKEPEKPVPKKKADPKPKTIKYEPRDMACAERMLEAIMVAVPSVTKEGKNLKAWANEIRLMREVDKREYGEIWKVFEFANKHHFWYKNILSPSKLREKYDRLYAEYADRNQSQSGSRTGAKPTGSAYELRAQPGGVGETVSNMQIARELKRLSEQRAAPE